MVNLVSEGEVYVGRDYGSHEYSISPEVVQEYMGATDDHNPWYTGPSPFDGPVAPALILHSEVYKYPGWYLKNVYGNLHARQEWELFAPIMVGDSVTTHSFIADRYVKRGRDYVVNEVMYFGADGQLVSRGRTHQSFLTETLHEGVVIDKTREKSSERRFEVDTSAALEEVPPVGKDVTLDMCYKFSGPHKNYHWDLESAKKLGFPDVVVQGMQSVCFLSEMLTNRFGAGWYCGGRMAVNLVNILWQSERVTCRGFVRELTPAGSKQRAHLDIWCEKPDGTKTVVGTASAVV